jgi:hypothetical protein
VYFRARSAALCAGLFRQRRHKGHHDGKRNRESHPQSKSTLHLISPFTEFLQARKPFAADVDSRPPQGYEKLQSNPLHD